ncbi:MAG: Secretion protein HlyD family protein [Pedosphaera sp.]|nr:Secretion protein HlyD family protein [Pedosphaera sp.]
MNSTIDSPEPANQTALAPVAAPPTGKRNRLRWAILGLLLLAVVAWLAEFTWHAYRYEDTDDAFVAGHSHQISPQIDGRVQEVCVKDNQFVKAGDVLVRLDPLEFEIALQKAQATLAQANAQQAQALAAISQADAQLAQAQARITQAEAQARQTSAQLELARQNHERNDRLFKNDVGVIARADLDTTRGALDSGQAANDAANANLKAATAGVASAQAAHDAAEAQQATAKALIAAGAADVRDAQRKLSHTSILAPADGRIGNKNVEPGNRVQAGETLFALMGSDVWVVANFKETQLAKMHSGQPVDISIDALPGQTFHGTIESFAPASGAQFALLPPDNATGNFTKVVQRVPVRINLETPLAPDLAERLLPGLSAVVAVRVR